MESVGTLFIASGGSKGVVPGAHPLWPKNVLNFMQFLPPANEVWGKVIFLHLFVILFTGGAWSWGRGVPGRRGAWSRGLLPGGCLLLEGGAWSGGGGSAPGGYCCGRYASYWNAFLFFVFFLKIWQNRRLAPCRVGVPSRGDPGSAVIA